MQGPAFGLEKGEANWAVGMASLKASASVWAGS